MDASGCWGLLKIGDLKNGWYDAARLMRADGNLKQTHDQLATRYADLVAAQGNIAAEVRAIHIALVDTVVARDCCEEPFAKIEDDDTGSVTCTAFVQTLDRETLIARAQHFLYAQGYPPGLAANLNWPNLVGGARRAVDVQQLA